MYTYIYEHLHTRIRIYVVDERRVEELHTERGGGVKKPCSAVSEVKGNESKLQWLPRCLSKPRRGYLQTRANCRSGSCYLPELLIARAKAKLGGRPKQPQHTYGIPWGEEIVPQQALGFTRCLHGWMCANACPSICRYRHIYVYVYVYIYVYVYVYVYISMS